MTDSSGRDTGAVGEREESLDVERLAEAGANVLDGRRIGSVRLYRNTITPDDWQAIAGEYARLSVNEGGVAPVEPPPRQGVIVGAPETTRAEPTWTVTAPVARTEPPPLPELPDWNERLTSELDRIEATYPARTEAEPHE